MPDIVQLARGKLSDPILMDWALDRYQNAARIDPERRRTMEEAWFDDLTLRRWLDNEDRGLTARLFDLLPPERFSALGDAIGERWAAWRGRLSQNAAPIFARCRPALAVESFSAVVGHLGRDVQVVLGLLRSLSLLPKTDARTLLRTVADRLMASKQTDPLSANLALDELIPIALGLDREVAIRVIRDRLRHAENDRDLERVFHDVTIGLFGLGFYFQLAGEIRADSTEQRFVTLSPLFQPGTPLAELDRWSAGSVTLNDIGALLDTRLDEDARAVVSAMTTELQAHGLAEHWETYADFLIGAVAGACRREPLETRELDLSESVGLLRADLSDLPHAEALIQRLRDFDREAVTAELVDALEHERLTFGSIHVAEAMGRLGWESFAAPLADAMNEDAGDYLCEAARDALMRVGESAQRHLIGSWDRLDLTQRIYGVAVIEAIGGEPAADFAVERADELLAEDPEFWFQLAACAPDPRLLARLEPQLRRRQGPIDETFYVLARLLDADHSELDAVRERVSKRRADARARLAAFDQGTWFRDTLPLALRCPACGDVNQYDVHSVIIDPKDTRAGPVIGEDLTCASCGRWTDLEPTSEARLAVMAELMRLVMDDSEGLAGQSRVLSRAETSFGGRQVPVGAVIRRCKEAVSERPDSVADWVRLGHCYSESLGRDHAGLLCVERALRLEPNAIEAVLQQAELLAAQHQEAEAFRRLDEALSRKEHWRFFLADATPPAQVASRFADLYNRLLRTTGRTDHAGVHGATLVAAKKVGRNDLCPCGSGKKFKKCCLANE